MKNEIVRLKKRTNGPVVLLVTDGKAQGFDDGDDKLELVLRRFDVVRKRTTNVLDDKMLLVTTIHRTDLFSILCHSVSYSEVNTIKDILSYKRN